MPEDDQQLPPEPESDPLLLEEPQPLKPPLIEWRPLLLEP